MGKRTRIFWVALAVATAIMGGIALQDGADEVWLLPMLIIVWIVTVAALVPSRIQQVIGQPLRWLRRHPILYWLVLLVYVCVALGWWTVKYQPTNGRWLESVEYSYLLVAFWLLIFLTSYAVDAEQLREMGEKLGKSKLSGVMVTLTMIVMILMGAEAWLRIFYITTDAYGFTAMNYHWYQNFYRGHYNSLGYRDYEPLPDDEVTTRIAVLGDSFAMGHGINNIDETFPQMLERDLGAGYDVDVVAHSGWDSDVEIYYLRDYPLQPDVVILSYYLNDIDHLLTEPTQNPDAVFDFPDNPTVTWIVREFFVPNYIYYNLMQYTSPERTTTFMDRLVAPHMDDDLWAQQAWHLNEIYEWTQENDAQLVALVWPQIAAVEESIPATDRIRDFFLERDVPVVNMADVLIDQEPRQMIVNRFDSHPGVQAQRLAADALHDAISSLP
jgi:hypothetical protein